MSHHMADFITLSCPSCGAKLQITDDIDRFACLHCGNEHLVRRRGGIVSLAPVIEGLGRVQAGVDKTVAELAVARLSKEVEQLETKLAELEGMTVMDFSPPSSLEKFLKAGIVISGLFTLCALDSRWLLVFLAISVAYLVVKHQREREANEILNQKTEEVMVLLDRKKVALEEHLELIDG